MCIKNFREETEEPLINNEKLAKIYRESYLIINNALLYLRRVILAKDTKFTLQVREKKGFGKLFVFFIVFFLFYFLELIFF